MGTRSRVENDYIHQILLRVRRHCEQNAGRLDPDELERLADIILRIVDDDPEYPVRKDLEHHSQEIHSFDDRDDPVGRGALSRATPSPSTCGSLQALVARLLVAANLTDRKLREVARLYLWGHNTVEIAQILEVPRSTVQSRWRYAREHLQRALRDLAPSEWLTLPSPSARITTEQIRMAFHEDEARTRYFSPRHCPEGRERCATTGVCAFRAVGE